MNDSKHISENNKVPKIAHAFFKWYCREDRYEEIHGDIEEFFYEHVEKGSLWKAKLLYILDVLRSFQPYAWKKQKKVQNTKLNAIMLANHLKISIRTLKRNKAHALINIVGLAMSIACATVIYLITYYELSFDKHQTHYDSIYRVVIDEKYANGYEDSRATSMYPMAQAIRGEISDVESVTFIEMIEECFISIKSENINSPISLSKKSAYVDPEFLDIFSVDWIQGNVKKALTEPNCVVISEQIADILKSELSDGVIGEIIRFNNEIDLKVTGIIKDPPNTTDFPFKMLISSRTLAGRNSNYDKGNWGYSAGRIQTYLTLSASNAHSVEQKLSYIEEKFLDPDESVTQIFHLQPLNDIHFNENYGTFSNKRISMFNIKLLVVIGVLLLFIALINFVNLSAAKSLRSICESGIRKILGSTNRQLLQRTLVESTLIIAMATIVSMLFSRMLLTYLDEITGVDLEISFVQNQIAADFLITIFILLTFATAFIQSFIQIRLSPVDALKKKVVTQSNWSWLKKGLVSFQFITTQVLIIASIVIFRQLNYFNDKDMGFNKESILSIPLPGDLDTKGYNLIKTRLNENPAIIKSSLAIAPPLAKNSISTDVICKGGQKIASDFKIVDENYIDLFEFSIVAGRSFMPNDSNKMIVNEAFIKKMNIDDPYEAIGEVVEFWGYEMPIIGVLKDFHSASLHKPIEPLFIFESSWYNTLEVKVNSSSPHEAIVHIENIWKSMFPGYIFNYQYYDDFISSLYQRDKDIARLINLFCMISILICSMGLFGLISNQAIQKTKELGIRKVLGASFTNLISLLSKEFIIIFSISTVVSFIISFEVMQNWLDNFAYRIDLGISSFLTATVISILLLTISIGYQSVKAAIVNPVESLRDE